MAIDARIPLAAGQIESPLIGLGRGIQQGMQMANTAQAMQARQKQLTQQDAEALRNGLSAAFIKMKSLPMEQREAYKLQVADQIQQRYGVAIPQEEIAAFPVDDAALDAEIASFRGINTTPAQFGAQETFKDSKGNLFFGTQVRDPKTGQTRTSLSPVAGGPSQPVGPVQIVGAFGLTAEEQVKQKQAESEATTTGKMTVEASYLPNIRAAIKTAEQEAESEGEALSEYRKASVAMPGLRDMVANLTRLSDIATYTKSGRLLDMASRELGFGSTEGATARATMEAIVDNQMLPLLRETFGAAFTQKEGETLRKTLLDIDAPPEEKKARLNAFLELKERQLQEKETRAQITPTQPVPKQRMRVSDPVQQQLIDNMTDEQYAEFESLR